MTHLSTATRLRLAVEMQMRLAFLSKELICSERVLADDIAHLDLFETRFGRAQGQAADRADMIAKFSNPIVTALTILMVLSAAMHMKLGLQVVIEDYVHGEGLKIASLMAVKLASIAFAVACIFAILKVAL